MKQLRFTALAAACLIAFGAAQAQESVRPDVGKPLQAAQELIKAGKATSLQGTELKITADGDTMKVDDASVVCGNVQTANATVFIIDSVLMPAK